MTQTDKTTAPRFDTSGLDTGLLCLYTVQTRTEFGWGTNHGKPSRSLDAIVAAAEAILDSHRLDPTVDEEIAGVRIARIGLLSRTPIQVTPEVRTDQLFLEFMYTDREGWHPISTGHLYRYQPATLVAEAVHHTSHLDDNPTWGVQVVATRILRGHGPREREVWMRTAPNLRAEYPRPEHHSRPLVAAVV